MTVDFKKMSRAEKKAVIDNIVSECRALAHDYVKNWKPIDKKWEILEGTAYLRLSDDGQVAVEKGSLEQQINIAISEAENRSRSDHINYRITKFFIEPGITGKDDTRPEFNLMWRQITKKKYRFVIIKELSRLSRISEVWKRFFRECIEHNCEVMIRGLPINPNDPTQILQLDILAAFAEYESNQTSKRIKESHYAAMTSSGKFNGTSLILGLDPLIVNGQKKVGFYVKNEKEAETLKWIMETFVRYGTYADVTRECKKLGISNKNGTPFTKNTLQGLLSNTKIIGTWELNKENKGKSEKRLMHYEKYAEIDLPHDPIVPMELWEQVQETMKRITSKRRSRNEWVKRVYPLTGLLFYKDGTSFYGKSAWGNSDKVRTNYYYNKDHNLTVPAEMIEQEVARVVGQILKNNSEMKDAIIRRSTSVESVSKFLDDQINKIEVDLRKLHKEKGKLNKRLDFILDDCSPEEAKEFRKEFKQQLIEINAQIRQLTEIIDSRRASLEEVENEEFDWKKIHVQAGKVLDVIKTNNPKTLKNAYATLFAKIVVGPKRKDEKNELTFYFHDDSVPAVTGTEKSVVKGKLVGPLGLEPRTTRL